jgi:hypothetical protein
MASVAKTADPPDSEFISDRRVSQDHCTENTLRKLITLCQRPITNAADNQFDSLCNLIIATIDFHNGWIQGSSVTVCGDEEHVSSAF